MKIIKELIPYLVIIFIVICIRTFFITPVMVQGESMVPTLAGNEIMLLKKYDTNYQRFDIVVVSKSVEGDNLIKRVIGLPGETIKYRNEKLYINDLEIKDIYAYGKTGNIREITLADDEYFLMGDNREISLDSRTFGVIKKAEIEGKTNFIIYPFNKIGKAK